MEAELYTPQPLRIGFSKTQTVSGLLHAPDKAKTCLVLAHGAGAGMSHPFMAAVAAGLHERGVATLRYQFAYMEKGSRRPDGPALAQAVVRAAVNEARRRLPGLAIFAGGKSFGGRMTSQAQAEAPLPDVRGIAFLGFPLHPANKPSTARAGHLFDIRIPMLLPAGNPRRAGGLSFSFGRITEELGERATLEMFPDADHSFHVPARSGRTDEQVQGNALDALADWMTRTAVFGSLSG